MFINDFSLGRSTSMAVAVGLTRLWTRLYTWRVPPVAATARRAEIDSDLWEMQQDEAIGGVAAVLVVLHRLAAGVADDLAWRVEQVADDEQLLVRRVVALVAACVVVLGLWSIPALMARGRDGVRECASAAPAPETTPELRLELVRCAGEFFRSVSASR
jgi:hypothetical protein